MQHYVMIKAEINPNSPAQVKGADGFAKWCKSQGLLVERHQADSRLERDERALGGFREIRVNPRIIVYGNTDDSLTRQVHFKLGSYGLKPAVQRHERDDVYPEDRPAPYRHPLPPRGRNGLGFR